MRFLKTYKIFEANLRDIAKIARDFDEYFTVSFEFEIETLDESDVKINFDDFDEFSVDEVISQTIKDMRIRSKIEKEFIKNLSYRLLDHIEFGKIDISIFNSLFDTVDLSNRQRDLTNHLKSVIMSFISKDDLEYLKSNVMKYLPNFVNKWNDKLEYVGDPTLNRGIEIKPKSYLGSLSEAIGMLDDFYSDLQSQDYWKFTDKTGLHINIGTKSNSNWNPIKGLLILNDFSKSESTPYVFSDMEWRMMSDFCGSMIPHISNLSQSEKENLKSKISLQDISTSEDILNDFLSKNINDWGIKNLGFNISKIKDNYVEFRYVGGEISKEVVIKKMKYFSFIVYCMTNPEYKRREYLKKLYKFITEL